VREDLERLGYGPETFGVVHRDPKLENLVFEGERLGAIDFDLTGLGHYLFDLKVFRRSLEHRHPDRLGPLWEAFLGGYEGGRPLPEDLERCLLTFDVMQKVAAVNRSLAILGSVDGDRRRPATLLKKAPKRLEGLLERRGTRP
jgi:Ser/Thr protein kinase RdoA (MazF antagonist)